MRKGNKPVLLSDEQLDEMRKMWFEPTVAMYEIAEYCDCSVSWLVKNRERLGLPYRVTAPRRPDYDPTPEEIEAECVKLRAKREKVKAESSDTDPTPYRTTCMSWDGVQFSVRTA